MWWKKKGSFEKSLTKEEKKKYTRDKCEAIHQRQTADKIMKDGEQFLATCKHQLKWLEDTIQKLRNEGQSDAVIKPYIIRAPLLRAKIAETQKELADCALCAKTISSIATALMQGNPIPKHCYTMEKIIVKHQYIDEQMEKAKKAEQQATRGYEGLITKAKSPEEKAHLTKGLEEFKEHARGLYKALEYEKTLDLEDLKKEQSNDKR